MDHPVSGDTTGTNQDRRRSAGLKHPDRIGPYHILRVIGEGGMGTVYEAEQTEPIHRHVAVKMMKLGMDTRQVVARFDAERQALAVMDHPNIAKVLDAGASDAARPYFVMEYVRGVALTEYCDTNCLSTSERVALFISVCGAVQHAHQKGVIHRDLKPSNILVSDAVEGRVPKVIDFGIAKAIGQQLTDKTLVTTHGQAIGTAAYMSPEQAEMSNLDVDTRTDVYSLGVILYELLVGCLPIDPEELGVPAFIARLVMRETDPPTPSSRLRGLGDEQQTIARSRHTDPGRLRRELSGDLDWIVMKAMEKDRTRRYDTPNAFATDLGRYLASETVLARPHSTVYRMRRFVRRHRVAVSVSAVLFLLLGGFVVTIVRQANQIAEERDKAVQVATFLENLFEAPNPFATERRDTLRVSDILSEASEQARTGLGDQPVVQAQMLHVLGKVNRNLGNYERARPLLEDAWQLRRATHGHQHQDALVTGSLLGFLLWDMGEYDDAERIFRDVLETLRGRRIADPSQLADVLQGLANVLQARGEYSEAESLYRDALTVLEREHGAEASSVADAQANLATVLFRKADLEGAESLFRKSLETRRKQLGDDHPSVGSGLNNLAFVLSDAGKPDEAATLYREALAISRRNFDSPHPTIARSLNNLGAQLTEQGDLGGAEPLLREALEMRRAIYGEEHQAVGTAMSNLASVLLRQGKLAEAERMYMDALVVFHVSVGSDHPRVASVQRSLGTVHHDQQDHAAAVESYRTAFGIRIDKLGENHPLTAAVQSDLGRCLTELGRYEEAERHLLESEQVLEERREEQEERWKEVRERIVQLYRFWGKLEAAQPFRESDASKDE